jgi:RHS repeat-associated protein
LTSVNSTLEGLSSYTYWQNDQLVGVTNSGAANESYAYDANGNRNTTGFTTTTDNRMTTSPGFRYMYDNEGNLIRKTNTTNGSYTLYTWDHRNRLTKATERTFAGSFVSEINYEYDAFNRLSKRYPTAGAITSWVYDEGINPVFEYNNSASPSMTHRYLWSDQVDELLADEQNPGLSYRNILWSLADQLGSIRDIADANETTGITSIANHRRYDSTGKRISETNASVDLVFGYTGKLLDETTGLQNNLNRWLDPATGRRISQDPIGFGGGDANLYRYVGNRPTMATDPSGLKGWEIGGLTPGQWTYATGVLFFEWGANGYRAGKALVTGEAGKQMGERAVNMHQNQTGDKFDGDFYDWMGFSNQMLREVTGSNSIAEGSVGVDMAELRELDGWERGTRISSGTGALAGTVAGPVGLTRAGAIRVPYTPNTPKLPIPPWMNPTLRNPFRPRGPSFEGLSAGEIALVRDALHEAGMSNVDIVIVGADMPECYFGMTLGDSGFAVIRAILGNAKELTKTLKHELQHVLDRRSLGDPGAYGQYLEDAAEAAEGR